MNERVFNMFGKDKAENRFRIISNELMETEQNVDIIVDKETKVQYLVISQGGSMGDVGGTVLVDKEGTPLLAGKD
ncbi:hypothetical protein KBX59_14705 [Lentilactobacillus hilgardii]|nr:hypothetical protein [Lentilactobacillus hilgardii]MCP9351095.1 hypothetical protein [Lentilactobacillus hilgardii]MCP9353932.1 hypothetical protein [Lentilactobacillus hilgardii]